MLPDDPEWLALFFGCLSELSRAYNYELYGASTPEETANIFSSVIDDLSLKGKCHMVGEIIMWPVDLDPPDDSLLECIGQSVSKENYPDLFAVLGTTYGGDGDPYFTLPSMAYRIPVGGYGGILPTGGYGGELQHTLTVAELPAHVHTEITAVAAAGAALAGVPIPSAVPGIGNTGSVGSAQPFYLYPPYVIWRYFIQS